MEQIIIKRGNTLIPLASKKTATSIKSATQNVALLGDDTLNIVVVSPFKLDFLIGDTTFVYGNIYKLNRLPKVKKNGMYEFEYELEFEGAQYDMMRVTYDLTIDTTSNQLADVSGDSLTGNLRRFATVMVSNLNRVFKNMWELGECPDTAEDKTLTFSESENCLSVIQNLCKEFETEFEVLYSGYSWKYTINFKKIGKTFPYKFEFGKNNGLYQLTRENVSTSNIVTRLKVYGSTENITAKYRAQRLCLPNRSKRDSYIEDAAAVKKYGIWEARKYFDDIKPSRTGKVEKIFSDSVLKFVDSTMFDLNEKDESGNTKYLLAETSAKVHFNTGNLAGYEFEVHSYDHATHTFTLKKQTDERGNVFPSESTPAFRFSVKDEYKLIDIALPQSYIDEAESELAKQGRTYYNQNSQPKVQYGLSVTDSFLASMLSNETNGNVIWVGDYIPVKDSDVDVDKSVRVKSFKRDLMKDYSYTLTISDMSITSSITNRVVSELIEHDKAISINQLLDPARARANWRSSREVLNMVFDPDGDYYTDKIKPASIDTMALSVGAKAMQFGLQNTVFQPNYLGKANRIVYKGGVLTHYTIKEESAVSWILADGDVTLKNENAYYIYAKCSKKDNSGSIIFSQSQIKTNEDVGYYHFFIGVLNSVDSELKARSLALTYGFTMINGRFIKTGRIESADGTTYFDLDNSEIGGRIVFTQNGQKKTLEEIAAETLENKNYINNTLPGILDGFTKQIDGKIETWYQESDPSTNWKNEEKDAHVGDLWYNTKTNEAKRYSSKLAWETIKDADAIKALQDASKAQDTADGKRRVFVATPTTPYDVGDLWTDGKDLKRCIKAKSSGNFVDSDWGLATNYTGDESLNDFIENTYNSTISDIMSQLDGVIETHFGNGIPTLSNEPAKNWNTNALKENHLGDMYYDNDSGIGYRFSKEGSTYKWSEVRDTGVASALEAASRAQDTADGKRRVFVATPTPPYDEGDLWASGTFLKRCINSRTSGRFLEGDWDLATNYTGDESLNAFVDGLFDSTVSDIYNQLDGKLESWYTSTDPSSKWGNNDKPKHVGDQWFNTSSNRLYHYTKNGTKYEWNEIKNQDAINAASAASKAQDTADGKRTVFVAEPKPPYQIGDLWVDGKELRRCVTARSSGTYVATDWAIAVYYDNTKTTIDGGIVTSGTIQVAGDKKYILAGITGKGSSGDSIRFWAGTTFENRSIAPFRVQQNGKVYMKDAVVEGEINSIIGNIGRWILSDGIIKSKASIDEKAKVKIPAIQLDSINGKILIGENIVLDKLGLSLISNNYEKLRVSNCQIGEYSKYLVAQKHTGEEHLYFNVPGGYIFASRTWIPKYIKPEVAKVHFGYFGAGTVLTINQIDILNTVPKPNVQGISVGMRFNGAPSVICTLRCNGVSVAQTSTYYGGAKMSGESFSMQMKWAKTFIIDKSNEGDYELEIAVQPLDIYASSGTCAIGKTQGLITVDFDFTRGSYERTVIANDGLMSCWKDGVMMMTNAGFIVNFGSYHLKITKEGIKKSTDSGVNWKDV